MRPNNIDWSSPRLIVHLVLILGCGVAALVWPRWYGFGLLGVGLLIGLIVWLVSAALLINERIFIALPGARGWSILTKTFPSYKFVDILRAAEWLAAQNPRHITIASEHYEALSGLLTERSGPGLRRIKPPTMLAHTSGPGQEVFLPSDCFWLLRRVDAETPPCVIRVTLNQRFAQVRVEIVAPSTAQATAILARLLAHAADQSIYRGHMVRISFGHELRAAYDQEDSNSPIGLSFLHESPVTDETIVLDETIRLTVERTLVDFHQRRTALMRLGVPGKRGVLFYGPPGTGKTYTCRYLAHRLAPVTTIIATGYALMRMKEICALAAMLQPAMVLLEDVDLVFASRELNAYNTVLGEFMDQLDGFGEEHNALFVLTTNAIDRVESAIKDRPGRISQCIYFGPPNPALRKHYLERMLRAYPQARCDLSAVIAQTEGVSQAFLKELVFRSVQIASAARPADQPETLLMEHAHMQAALEEMLAGADQAGRRIIGFRIEV
jgi:ATPase family associated with various cellular activities (AAA)